MNIRHLRTAALVAGALALTACGPATESSFHAAAPASTAPAHLYLSILTPDQLQGSEDTGPAYVPADFTLPANADVTVTVTNFDDPDGLTGAKASPAGVLGNVQYETIADQKNPNAPGTSVTLDPTKISHTFTIEKLGLNVPIMAHTRVTFTFHTGAAGTYTWQCFVPCGNGPAGWNGPMQTKGYMTGTVTVA